MQSADDRNTLKKTSYSKLKMFLPHGPGQLDGIMLNEAQHMFLEATGFPDIQSGW
jgi:hypothetical protein